MRGPDLIAIIACCLFWAGNFVVSAWALGGPLSDGQGVPPLLLAAVRAGLVLLVMGIFLTRPRPDRFGRLLIVCACIGPVHLACLYTGLQTASASGGSIISQMLIPMAAVLSVIFLKERIGWVRGTAIAGAFAGTMVMLYEPGALGVEIGYLYILMAYVSVAIGTVLIKAVGEVDWRVYVAWTSALMLPVMAVASLIFESGQGAYLGNLGQAYPLYVAALYAALMVSIFSHGQYFRLLRAYPVNQVVPLTLLVPVFALVLGLVLLNERLSWQTLVGAALILPSVWVIARRQPA